MSFKLPGLPKKMPEALRQALFHSLQWDKDDKSGFFSFISSFPADLQGIVKSLRSSIFLQKQGSHPGVLPWQLLLAPH